MSPLTIVVGSRAGEGDEGQCLAALSSQVDGVEVIVVRDREGAPLPTWVTTAATRAGGLVPELWATGLRLAGGDVVALTAATMIPGPDWVDQTLKLHAQGRVAVGGPIEPGPSMRWVDWAVYFCRFSPYALPVARSDALEVAADNGSYRRSALTPHADLYEAAFLEPFVHRALRADGHAVTVVPDRVARVAGHQRLRPFLGLRFRHGRHHGRQRAAGTSRGRILAAAASTPLVPPLMTVRAARAIFAKRRLRARFVLAAPLVLVCYSAWALGELAGRLDAVVRRGGSA